MIFLHIYFLLAKLWLVYTQDDKGKDTCSESLGARKNGYLSDSAFRASSFLPNFGPEKGRLSNDTSAWIPHGYLDSSLKHWLQVDLGSPKTITGVVTKGFTGNRFFVRTFYLDFSQDGEIFDAYFHAKLKKKFIGNVDTINSMINYLPCPVVARYIRFVPNTLVTGSGVALKVDVLGCSGVQRKPPTMKLFKVKAVTANSVKLQWTQLVSNVEIFSIAHHIEGPEKLEYARFAVPVKKDEALPIVYQKLVTALSSCTKYKFILRSHNKEGCGISEITSITVTTKASKPIIPHGFAVENDIPEELHLSWQKSQPGYLCAKDIQKFQISYRILSVSNIMESIVEADSEVTSYKLTRLRANREYEVKIVAVNRKGTKSDFAVAREYVKGKPPSVPPNITTIVSTSPHTIRVAWEDPLLSSVHGEISGYTLHYRPKTTPESPYKMLGFDQIASKKEYLIQHLTEWTTYEVYVSLFNFQSSIGSEVKEVLVIGNCPGKVPTNISSIVTATTITVTWQPVPERYLPPKFDGYQVFYTEDPKMPTELFPADQLTTESYFELVYLMPGRNYSFAVAANSNGFKCPRSNTSHAITDSGPLTMPTIVNRTSVEPETIYVEWTVDPKVIPANFRLMHKEKEMIDDWKVIPLLGTERSHTITGVEAWKYYDVLVNLTSKGGRNRHSIPLPVLVQGSTPGKAPEKFKPMKIGYVSVTLIWGEIDSHYVPSPLSGYKLRYGRFGDSNQFLFKETKFNNITIDNLQHGTFYRFAVAGMTKNGTGVYSHQLELKTVKIEAPSRPEITSVENVNSSKSSEIKIEWTKTGEIPKSLTFVIILQDTAGKLRDLTYLTQDESSRFSLKLSVDRFIRYRVKIKSCVYHICGEYSEPKFITTKEGPPSEVENIAFVKHLDTVDISWSRPRKVPGIIRKYVLNVLKKAGNDIYVNSNEYPLVLGNMKTKYTMKNLPPFQDLIAEVTAYTVEAGPPAREGFRSPEGTPGSPSNLTTILLTKDTISIKWDPPAYPNGVIRGYGITYTGTKRYYPQYKHNKTIDISVDSPLRYRIKDLTPGTDYTIEVFAKTARGRGDNASESRRTPDANPLRPPPPAAMSHEIDSSSVVVRISPATELNGEIWSYEVIVQEIDSTRKRRNALPTNLTGYIRGSKMYITADIMKFRIPAKFQVGDGGTYNGYVNEPLKAETKYKIHTRATAKGHKGRLYGPASSAEVTTGVAPTPKEKMDFPIATIVGALVGFISLVIIVIIVVFYMKKRRRRKDKLNPFELGLISVQQHDEDEPDLCPRRRPASLTGDYPVRPDHPPISVGAFAKTVTKLHRGDNLGFKAEYNQLEIGKEYSWDTAHLSENKPKNRYANIVAYDHSRVIMSTINGVPGSDYINASYIDGFKKPNAYISTQGPLPNTFNDFWRMVWEVRAASVVMLTNLQEKNKLKCHKYWPDDVTEYGDILVTLARKEYYTDFNIRIFKLEKLPRNMGKNEIREVRQFHFTCWPDHGVPRYSTQMVNFRKKVRSFDSPDCGPTIVHCSAGVGRTGAYIVLDTMLDRAHLQSDIDIFNYIASMRTRRIAMVQTEEQYVFVHDAILEAIMTGKTDISVHNLKESLRKLDQIENDSRVSGFEKKWKTLNHSSPVLPTESFVSAISTDNIEKNRYSTALPIDNNRVLLQLIDDNEATTYINAAYVDSYKQKNAFILTQSPLPRTVADFWRMIFEHGSTSIVMLNAIDEGPDYTQFWPDTGIRDYGPISVKCLAEDDDLSVSFNSSLKPMYRTPTTEIVARNFMITDARSPSKSAHIKFFQYLGWTETRVPNSSRPIINLITQLERWKSQSENNGPAISGPLTILCSDGIGRSGTLAAILYILERVKIDQVFDAFQAIKTMRMQRPHIVKYMDQYKYIHFAVQEYLAAFDEYTKL